MSGVADFTVLVVEDHDFQRRTILQILANLGVGSLLEAADGEAALTLLDAGKRPDIVVCDLDMPGMDGVELIRHVAERHSRVAVVFASGLEERVVAAADRTARAYGVTVLGAVQKPLTARRLLAAIGDFTPPRDHVAAEGEGDDRADFPSGDELLARIDADELMIRLQPIVGVATGSLAGAEIVAGWPPDGQPIDATAIGPIGGGQMVTETFASYLLDHACAAQRELAGAGHDVPISLKAPVSLLSDVALPDYWARAASEAGCDPRRITIEVSEESVLAEDATALDVLTRLRLKGFGVALGNAGSGAITSSQLERGPFGAVRISAGLLAEALASRASPIGGSALEASLELARELGLATEAAGCDSRAAWDLLAELGCEHALGTFVAEPMPAADIPGWASSWAPGETGGG